MYYLQKQNVIAFCQCHLNLISERLNFLLLTSQNTVNIIKLIANSFFFICNCFQGLSFSFFN